MKVIHLEITDELHEQIEQTVKHLNENSKQYYHLRIDDFIRIAIYHQIQRYQSIKEKE